MHGLVLIQEFLRRKEEGWGEIHGSSDNCGAGGWR